MSNLAEKGYEHRLEKLNSGGLKILQNEKN